MHIMNKKSKDVGNNKHHTTKLYVRDRILK